MISSAEERLALALEAAGLGTWTWDMASATTIWDVRLEELHGLPPGGFGGTFDDWLAALHPDDRAECLRRVEDAIERRGAYVLLHRTTWPDGSVHWIECRGRVVVDDEGMPTGTIGVAMDVTDREQAGVLVTAALDEKADLLSSLQQALLPSVLPSVAGVTVAARYVATRSNIGGDWYAVVPLPGGRLGLGIGDVAGHGLAAVADMAGARFSLRALAMDEPDPQRVMTRLNEAVQLFEDDALVTALVRHRGPRRAHLDVRERGTLPGGDPSRRRVRVRRADRSATATRGRRRRTDVRSAPSSPARSSCCTPTGSWNAVASRWATACSGSPRSWRPGLPTPRTSPTMCSASSSARRTTTTSRCSSSRWTEAHPERANGQPVSGTRRGGNEPRRREETRMPRMSATVKNEKRYEALKDKGMSKARAARIANSPAASKHGGEKSHSGSGKKHQGGTTAQHKAAGRKGGRAAAKKR